MGVTIHFEGRVKGATAYSVLIDELREFAASHDWKCEELAKLNAVLERVRDEIPWDYSGPTFGLELWPHPACDPLRFEFDKDYYVQEFVKAQCSRKIQAPKGRYDWQTDASRTSFPNIQDFAGAPYRYAAETGGAVSGLRVAAMTSGRRVSSRGVADFCPAFG